MPGIDSSSRVLSSSSWWKPVVVIAVAGLLAFTLWTLPNWGIFWSAVVHFSELWQLPANRMPLISLSLKIASPLFFMGITGMMVWMYSLNEASRYAEGTETRRGDSMPQRVLAEPGNERGSTHEMQANIAQAHAVFVPAPSYIPPASGFPHSMTPPSHPTPLAMPVVPRPAPALPRLTFLAKDEQPEVQADQQRAHAITTGDHLSGAPAFLSSPAAPTPEQDVVPAPLISLRLLKDVSMTITVPGGGHIVVPLTMNAKRVQLLAYIAWRRGELIDRDKIMEHVFGWGLSDEEATEDKLAERFESHKKLLRRKLREVVVEQVNKPAGRAVIDPEIDPFVSDSGFWGLSPLCRVEDLDAIERHYAVIATAKKEGKLGDAIPKEVRDACEQLMAQYPGDFLESLIKKYPGEFRSWQGRSSWVRKPYTHYRDYYLDALWYAAEDEWRKGQQYAERAGMDEVQQRRQQEHFGRAAQTYQRYAMYACNSRFDAKVTFGAHGEVGERIGMSERALRRCVVLLGAIGRTDLVNQVWSSYSTQMKSVSEQRWHPGPETLADAEAARAQTSAYRFAAQVAQRSSVFAERHEDVS